MSARHSHPEDVVIEFHGQRPTEMDEIAATDAAQITIVESKGFAATEYTLQVLVAASAGGAIRALIAIVKAHLESKQHIVIKADGVELAGLSAKDAERILGQLAATGKLPSDTDRA